MAEDSEDDYELLLRELQRGGYRPVAERVASTEALAAALERPWDLIISDWFMPALGGLAVLDALGARRPAVPCMIHSGTHSQEAAVQALRAGALDFLSKDKPRLLVPAVQRVLREAGESRARAAAEQELRLSEERYRKSFEVTPEVLLTYDIARERIIDVNASAARFFQRSVEELRASPLGSLSPPLQPDGRTSVEAGRAYLARVLGGEDARFPWMYSIGGELIPAEVSIIPLPTSSQPLARISVVDLRERLRHQLRTPLDAILGSAALLYEGRIDPGSPEHRRLLGEILSSGRHLWQLIDELIR